jgi:N-acetylneuraminic acid mutarotase
MYIDQRVTYGVHGEDNPLNTPGARYYSASWTDASGTFWLFGGRGFDSKANSGVLNDLWKYNPVTGNWTWI